MDSSLTLKSWSCRGKLRCRGLSFLSGLIWLLPLPCGASAVIGLSGRAGYKKGGWLRKAREIVRSKEGF